MCNYSFFDKTYFIFTSEILVEQLLLIGGPAHYLTVKLRN